MSLFAYIKRIHHFIVLKDSIHLRSSLTLTTVYSYFGERDLCQVKHLKAAYLFITLKTLGRLSHFFGGLPPCVQYLVPALGCTTSVCGEVITHYLKIEDES